MDDREMLEMAAKAAGYEIEWVRNSGCHYRCEEEIGREQWCPLDDDGDALRLAMRLRITIDHNHPADQSSWVHASSNDGRTEKVEEFDDECDRCAATRMAIVRAAAEIGMTSRGAQQDPAG